jgi:hypothetical protein
MDGMLCIFYFFLARELLIMKSTNLEFTGWILQQVGPLKIIPRGVNVLAIDLGRSNGEDSTSSLEVGSNFQLVFCPCPLS